MCVLTCEPEPQVAHIVPFSLGRLGGPLQQTMPSLFTFLRVFAGPTILHSLETYLVGVPGSRGQINRLENLLSLCPTVHHHFGEGTFVLEPVGDPLAGIRSRTDVLPSYQVRFSWVTENRPIPSRVEGEEGHPSPEGVEEEAWDLTQVMQSGVPMAEDDDPIVRNVNIVRNRIQDPESPRITRSLRIQTLETGFVFTLSTNDPVGHPLPHPDLLVVHAAIMRVCRSAGMAEPQEEEDWDSGERGEVPATPADQDMPYTLSRFLAEETEEIEDPGI